MICVSIRSSGQLSLIEGKDIKLVELRLDLIEEPPGRLFPQIDVNLQTIATCRPGNSKEHERFGLLQEAITLGADFIDLEIETPPGVISRLKKHARENNCQLILSWHDFKKTPGKADLQSIIGDCYAKGADIAKIACMVHKKDDILNLMSLYELPGRKVVLGMGKMGAITRIVAPFLGSEFTYASTSGEEETAPGQLTVDELLTIFNILKQS
ncbi:MAG: type I 3-dehydroquinate dehydratase [Bacteroidales bacterium]|nr:type I 3-dehydroquinate dehydratase [Bacteroidales bacterium]MBN2697283.1 type I 3-dehydroquinate dehydratase [Bacteroidales bacterium]